MMDLFYEAKLKFNGIMEFATDFGDRVDALHQQHLILQQEMQQSARHQEILEREEKYRKRARVQDSSAC